MRCGISTACFFPEETLKSLKIIAQSGIKYAEVFLNTFSEIEDDYAGELLKVKKQYGLEITSVHSFVSAMEAFFFYTPYKGRFDDGAAIYRKMFRVCNLLGSDKLVFHGAIKTHVSLSYEEYAEGFNRLSDIALEYGVTLCQENVSYCYCGKVKSIKETLPFIKNPAYVLDLKQVRKAGENAEDMVLAMGGNIKHLHLSDISGTDPCTAPGDGTFDFKGFFELLKRQNFSGSMVIELYNSNVKNVQQLVKAADYINGFCDF